jgi:hypothetical protein
MAEGRPVLTQINVIAGDLRRSLDFYRQVGMSFPRPLEKSNGSTFPCQQRSPSRRVFGARQLEFCTDLERGLGRLQGSHRPNCPGFQSVHDQGRRRML